MPRRLLCFSLFFMAAGLSAAKENASRSAEKMMYDAHVARSSWDKAFPGFRADVEVTIDGNVERGTVTVGSDGKVKLKLPKGENARWAKSQMASIISHRFVQPRKEYKVSFADKIMDHPLGRLIKFEGNRHNFYRINGNVITEVHRKIPPLTKFTITVSDVAKNAEGKLLPSHFNVSYWNAKTGDLIENEDYQEQWSRVGKYDLPQRRLMIKTGKDSRKVYELKLSHHKLLNAE